MPGTICSICSIWKLDWGKDVLLRSSTGIVHSWIFSEGCLSCVTNVQIQGGTNYEEVVPSTKCKLFCFSSVVLANSYKLCTYSGLKMGKKWQQICFVSSQHLFLSAVGSGKTLTDLCVASQKEKKNTNTNLAWALDSVSMAPEVGTQKYFKPLYCI